MFPNLLLDWYKAFVLQTWQQISFFSIEWYLVNTEFHWKNKGMPFSIHSACYGTSASVGSQDAVVIFDHWCLHADFVGRWKWLSQFYLLRGRNKKWVPWQMHIQEIFLCRRKEIAAKWILIWVIIKAWQFLYLFICEHFLCGLLNGHL